MLKKCKLIANSRQGLNRISFEIEPTKEQLASYDGYQCFLNFGNEEQLKGFLDQKFISNLEYLEGMILLEQITNEK